MASTTQEVSVQEGAGAEAIPGERADRLTHFCFHCYARNRLATGPCVSCGAPVAAPPGATWEERLVWALGHPVPDIALVAARAVGVLRVTAATPRLRELVASSRDPFLAAAALESLVAIEGAARLEPDLRRLAERGSLPVRAAASQALRRADG